MLLEQNYLLQMQNLKPLLLSYPPQKLKSFGHVNWTISPVSLVPSIAAPASATATSAGGTGNTQPWQYQITAVFDDGTNNIEESLPVTSNAITAYSSTLQATVTWGAVTGSGLDHKLQAEGGTSSWGGAIFN